MELPWAIRRQPPRRGKDEFVDAVPRRVSSIAIPERRGIEKSPGLITGLGISAFAAKWNSASNFV